MEEKPPKNIYKNIPHQQNQNIQSKLNKKTNINSVRPITGKKLINKSHINLSKKSNTPKKISVINLNEEISLKNQNKQKNINIKKKNEATDKIKKQADSNINKNKANKSQTVQKNLNIVEQLSNLTSLYNALSFINLKLDSIFFSQKQEAEASLNDKYSEAIDFKEKNFKLFQQMNSMTNIIDIDDYFLNYYQKIMDIYPKISNILENMNDIVSNVNYSIDRMYLVNDLLCDENILEKNIIQIKNDFEIMNNNIDKKSDEIKINKKKYEELYNRLKNNEAKIKDIENRLDTYKQNVLTNNIDVIYQKLYEKNKKILNEILND